MDALLQEFSSIASLSLALIQQYKQALDSTLTQLTSIQGQLSDETAKETADQTSLATLNKQVSDLQAQLTDLQNKQTASQTSLKSAMDSFQQQVQAIPAPAGSAAPAPAPVDPTVPAPSAPVDTTPAPVDPTAPVAPAPGA